jgi:hypothetical protein
VQQSYLNALLGTLASPSNPTGQQYQISFRNKLPISIQISWLDNNGLRQPIEVIPPNGLSQPTPAYVQDWFLATSATSGSFIGAVCFTDQSRLTLTFDSHSLLSPNDIGPIPAPNSDQVIPGDSPQVLVGCGLVAGAGPNCVVREQAWQRSPESYCLAPGETKTVSVTVMDGRQETTTDSATVSSSLSTSASAGWGPISTSISASLSSSSTHSQQVTIQTQTVRYVSETLSNNTQNIAMYFRWCLIDVVTVVDPNGKPLASVVVNQAPTIITGPFNPSSLPAPPSSVRRSAPAISAAVAAKLPSYMQRSIEVARALRAQDLLLQSR